MNEHQKNAALEKYKAHGKKTKRIFADIVNEEPTTRILLSSKKFELIIFERFLEMELYVKKKYSDENLYSFSICKSEQDLFFECQNHLKYCIAKLDEDISCNFSKYEKIYRKNYNSLPAKCPSPKSISMILDESKLEISKASCVTYGDWADSLKDWDDYFEVYYSTIKTLQDTFGEMRKLLYEYKSKKFNSKVAMLGLIIAIATGCATFYDLYQNSSAASKQSAPHQP